MNKRNSQCGNLTTTNTSWEERGKRRRRKEGSRPLHEKNLFTLIRLRSFFPVYYTTIGTMNTERQRLNGCSSSHTSTYRDSSVLLLQYPNGHDKNPAKKSCDYGLKTLVICPPPHSLATQCSKSARPVSSSSWGSNESNLGKYLTISSMTTTILLSLCIQITSSACLALA